MPRKRGRYDKREVNAYGGELQKSRKGRFCARPIVAGHLMHLIFKSTHAEGEWSFRKPENYQKIGQTIEHFGKKHGVEVHDYAIHYNHVHMSVNPSSRQAYVRFIRAITSSIAMFIMGVSRWTKKTVKSFFNFRPYSRIAFTPPDEGAIDEYIQINKLTAGGFSRREARLFLNQELKKKSDRLKEELRKKARRPA